VERYWPQVHKLADDHPQPAFTPYFSMAEAVVGGLDNSSAQVWIDQAMARDTTSSDTHPALKDRLKAIGQTPCLKAPAIGSTADRLLGAALGTITDGFDSRWKDRILPSWEDHYRDVKNGRAQLAAFNERVENGDELTLQEAFDRAQLTENIDNNPTESLVQLRALHQRAPDDATVCIKLGARLLFLQDAAGRALVEHAMQQNADLTSRGIQLLRDYCLRNGENAEAQAWNQRLLDHVSLQESASKERNVVRTTDTFDRHALEPETVSQLISQLKSIAGIRSVFLVRKCVKYLTDNPCYVLGYSVTGFFQRHSSQRAQEVLRKMQAVVKFPGETLIICIDGKNSAFRRKFRWRRAARLL